MLNILPCRSILDDDSNKAHDLKKKDGSNLIFQTDTKWVRLCVENTYKLCYCFRYILNEHNECLR